MALVDEKSSNYLKNQLARDAWRRRDQLWKKFLFGAKRQATFAYCRVNKLPNFTSPCLFQDAHMQLSWSQTEQSNFSTNEFIAQSIAKNQKSAWKFFPDDDSTGEANPFNDPRPWTLIWICKSMIHSDAKYRIQEKNSHAKSLLLTTILGDPFCRLMNLSNPLNCPFLLLLQIQEEISCMWFA